jgi:hypothetical protein
LEKIMEIGVFTVSDVTRNPLTGKTPTEGERIKAAVAIAKKVEEIGMDVYATGEHHNPPFYASSPTTILGYIAAQTERIKLSTSTTLITTNDPVKIAEDFATLQHLADGRVDLILGRGNTGPVYPWFGKNQQDSVELTIENYNLLRQLWDNDVVNWEGKFRTPLRNFTSTPRPLDGVAPSSGTDPSAPRRSPRSPPTSATGSSPTTSSGPRSTTSSSSGCTASATPTTATAPPTRQSWAWVASSSWPGSPRTRSRSSVRSSTTPRSTATARGWRTSWPRLR